MFRLYLWENHDWTSRILDRFFQTLSLSSHRLGYWESTVHPDCADERYPFETRDGLVRIDQRLEESHIVSDPSLLGYQQLLIDIQERDGSPEGEIEQVYVR